MKIYDENNIEIESPDIWDEYKDILRFIAFTDKELSIRRIDELKALLRNTDYMIIKIMEGTATWDEYKDIITQKRTVQRNKPTRKYINGGIAYDRSNCGSSYYRMLVIDRSNYK